MNGKTHLAIGASIGAACTLYFSPAQQLDSMVAYIGVASFSALAADLDGPSILTRKLTKLSRNLHQFTLIGGIAGLAFSLYLWLTTSSFSPLWIGASVAAILIGLIVNRSAMRNALVSIIGAGLGVYGISEGWYWLIGLGLFTVIAPWLKHRGLTHTIWVVPIWGLMGYGLEQQLAIEGLGLTASLGYLSHIIADMLTPAGVRWLYPLTKKKFKLKL